jgi:hypothetical protein
MTPLSCAICTNIGLKLMVKPARILVKRRAHSGWAGMVKIYNEFPSKKPGK